MDKQDLKAKFLSAKKEITIMGKFVEASNIIALQKTKGRLKLTAEVQQIIKDQLKKVNYSVKSFLEEIS